MSRVKTVVNVTAHDVRRVANWPLVINALREGHKRPKADIGDTFVHNQANTMLVRSAYVPGIAAGVKAATVVPGNVEKTPPLPSIHAQIMLFDPDTGQLMALVDGTEVTGWKTAADSALGSDLLSRPDSEGLLMVGAGAMARPLIEAHLSVRPSIRKVVIWNRSPQRAHDLLAHWPMEEREGITFEIAEDLPQAAAAADIISCATMSHDPVLMGDLVSPGTHVDLVGAYKPDMREADDELLQRGRWFVDSYDTTLDHIGELKIPLQQGVIDRDHICGDLHALVEGASGRQSDDEITVFKNGGGAHLDVMVSAALVEAAAR